MSDWFEISGIGQLAAGEMKEIMINRREILLVRIGDIYYATDNRCSHMGGKLSQGVLNGKTVTCPRHGSQFDVTNGNVVRWLKGKGLLSAIGKVLKSPKPINTHPVKLDGNKIMIQM